MPGESVYSGPEMNAYPPHAFGDLIGLRIVESGEGRAVAEIDVEERLHNPNGVVHGGVLFSLADTSMGAALRSLLEEGQISATIEIQIRYLRAVRSGTVRAETRVLHKGKRIAHFDTEIRNGDGDLVATAAGSFSILDTKSP
jgi:acyl-CoA thioesterase